MSVSDLELKFFADFIEKELGIIYSASNYFQLTQRLEKIAQLKGLTSGGELYQLAQKQGIHGDFKQLLLDTATNNETSFFRDPKIWVGFENQILPKLKSLRANAFTYRIWSAAASFGQEPFSIAITVDEFLQKNIGHPPIEIHSTDIAEHALKRCREAVYSQLEVQRGMPALKLIKYFEKTDDQQWRLKPSIKIRVQFKKQNLLDSFASLGQFDVIFCRYVLIYQDSAKKKEIINRLADCLVPGGFLVLGAAESAMGLCDRLTQVQFDGAIFYQKKQ